MMKNLQNKLKNKKQNLILGPKKEKKRNSINQKEFNSNNFVNVSIDQEEEEDIRDESIQSERLSKQYSIAESDKSHESQLESLAKGLSRLKNKLNPSRIEEPEEEEEEEEEQEEQEEQEEEEEQIKVRRTLEISEQPRKSMTQIQDKGKGILTQRLNNKSVVF